MHSDQRFRVRAALRLTALSTSLGMAASVLVMAAEVPRGATTEVDRRVVDLAGVAVAGWSAAVDLEIGAEMVAVTWATASTAEISVRGQRPDGTWTPVVHMHGIPSEGPELGEAEGPQGEPPRGYAGPAWLGDDIALVEIQLEEGSLRDLQLHAIDSEPVSTDGVAGAAGLPPAPGITSRAQWGADESWRNHNAGCATPRYASNAHYAIVHHTAGSNSYPASSSPAIIRGIYDFHVFGQGWCDIAYNFLIDRYGEVFEGRAGGVREAVIGGHAGGFNTGSVGVAVMGDFTSSPLPSAAYDSLRRLLAFKLGHHGIDPQSSTQILTVSHPSSRYPAGQVISMPTVAVHGDYSNTGCPGAQLGAVVPRLRSDLAYDLAIAPYDPRVVGDWDGNGTDTVGTYHDGGWSLRDTNTAGAPTLSFNYGYRGATPVVGDWNGDGRDGIGVYENGWWLLRNTPTPGPPEIAFQYGYGGAIPVVGDWNGDHLDDIAVYDAGAWNLRYSPSPGPPERWFSYGWRGPTPVAGDWNGDGVDGIGVWSAGSWSLRETASPGNPERSFMHGDPTDRATAGDWGATGHHGVGLLRGAYWYQRSDAGPSSDWVFWY